MFNFKRKRNLAIFISFIIIVAWDFKIGFDLVRADCSSSAILAFSAILLFLLALGKSIKSRKKAMEVYQAYVKTQHTH